MAKSTVADLRLHLFAQLEKLSIDASDLKDEKEIATHRLNIDTANAANGIATQIINSAKLEMAHAQMEMKRAAIEQKIRDNAEGIVPKDLMPKMDNSFYLVEKN